MCVGVYIWAGSPQTSAPDDNASSANDCGVSRDGEGRADDARKYTGLFLGCGQFNRPGVETVEVDLELL